jgi:hypothetical protein
VPTCNPPPTDPTEEGMKIDGVITSTDFTPAVVVMKFGIGEPE